MTCQDDRIHQLTTESESCTSKDKKKEKTKQNKRQNTQRKNSNKKEIIAWFWPMKLQYIFSGICMGSFKAKSGHVIPRSMNHRSMQWLNITDLFSHRRGFRTVADNSRVDEMIYEMNQSLFDFSCFQFEQVLSMFKKREAVFYRGLKTQTVRWILA